jgi:hypothetical protein|tara:strand:+ start:447 stop:887 length:441 start_codon:yes stop_codon:yes gene_type:complete
MILIRAIYLLLVLFFATFSMSYTLADTHDTNASAETSEEEALPLNDPFAGDESLSSGTNIISGSEEEREAMSLYKFKLVGIIEGEYEAYVTLVDASGETLSLTLHEELSAGVKLIDLRINEAIFEKDDNTYISINFKNQIKEMNEY